MINERRSNSVILCKLYLKNLNGANEFIVIEVLEIESFNGRHKKTIVIMLVTDEFNLAAQLVLFLTKTHTEIKIYL